MASVAEYMRMPIYFRWMGSFEEDPTPIVITDIRYDALGRMLDIIDENGAHYDWGKVISWRPAPEEKSND
jgi:hypothetical protein